MLLKKGEELKLMKRVILSQQTFCEETQRRNLAKNLIVSGISNGKISYHKELIETKDKVINILSSINIPLTEDQYKVHAFKSFEGKHTHTAKLIVEPDIKRLILSKT